MSEKFLQFTETEKLTKKQQKTIHGGDAPAAESDADRKGKVAAK
ncbi:hypothetical protein [Flavobacterium sp. Root901]|nr:hypothetical protein [Flavobacterium sp. Root901]